MSGDTNVFWEFSGLLYRQWRLISSVFASAFGGSLVYLVFAKSSYAATALILVGILHGTGLSINHGAMPSNIESVIDSEVEILRSDSTLLGTIESLDLASDPEFGSHPDATNPDPNAAHAPTGELALQQTLRSLRAAVDIERIGTTYLIAVTANSLDPARAALIANAIASYHIETRIEFAAIPARIVSIAQVPDSPGGPEVLPFLLIATLAAMSLAIVLAVLREVAIAGITNDSQLSTVSQKPVLGIIPRLKIPQGMPSPSQFLVLSPLSGFSESIRQIRAGIDRGMKIGHPTNVAARGRVIMVSSPLTDEGKTSIALSLARAYAASGTKTLIIDCDLRKPSVHRHLGVEPAMGLIEYLSGECGSNALASLIVLDTDTGLSVVVGSRQSETPTEQLVLNNQFERLVAAAIANFDIIILDTPPVLPVVDGLYLARYADAIVTVVKGLSTSRSDVKNTITRLDQSRRPEASLFTVLNQHNDVFGRFGRSMEKYQRG